METNLTKLNQTGIKGISTFLNSESIKSKFSEVIGDNANSFIASILAACNQNENLKKATTESIYTAALMAATLKLPINQNLGHAFLIPYTKNAGKPNEVTECQFQIAAKGFKQLAQRSGQYLLITDSVVYKGQLVEENPLTGFKFDFTKKSNEVIGYVSYFKLLNGFESTFYMTKEEVEKHATKYSQSYKSSVKWVKDSSRWTTDFGAMAIKTVMKLNISKNGPLSIDMQKAMISDQSIIRNNDTMEVSYIDVPDANQQIKDKKDAMDLKKINLAITKCETPQQLEDLQLIHNEFDFAPTNFEKRKEEIKSGKKVLKQGELL